jgi:RNA polymerase sigma factor (sigma-70 family)
LPKIYFVHLFWLNSKIFVEKLKKIIQGCLDNNRQSQSELYKMFAGKMYGVCLRYARDHSDAQDVLQEGFVKVFRNLHEFKWSGSFEGWMKRIFVNHALDKYRSRFSFLSLDDLGQSDDLVVQNDFSPVDSLSEKEILALIQQLPDQYRIVFNLYVVEGLSHQEIAVLLNIGESTSRSNLARARTILKEKLDFNSGWVEKAI